MDTLQRHLVPYALDIARTSAWLLILMVVFVPLERLSAIHPQKIFRKGIFTDLAYYFLNNLVPKILLTVPIAGVAWALRQVVPEEVQMWTEDLPLWARLSAAMVVGELGFYWGHRWTHQVPLLWRFHAIHHSAEEMDWLVGTRAHPFDLVFVRLCGFIPMYALGLAQPVGGAALDVVPVIIMLIGTFWGFFIHSNLRWRFGWLSLLISTPAFHHWHHTNDEHINKNYAPMLPWMDKLFGTLYMPKKQWPTKYGIDAPTAPGFAGQLIQPFESQPKAAASAAQAAS